MKELDIEQTCSDWLALDGWRTLKTDPVRNREWGKGFGELGMADRLYIRYHCSPDSRCPDDHTILRFHAMALVMWIEWKSKRSVLSQHQLDWHAAERARGALVFCAKIDFPATIEGFQRFYLTTGLARNLTERSITP